MHTHLISALAQERTADIQRRAERNRLLRGAAAPRKRPPRPDLRFRIREATPADAEELQRLAQLDSSDVPRGPLLVAEVGDQLWSALSLRGGAVIADPFHPTAELTALLRAQVDQHRTPRARIRLLGRSRWSVSTPAGPASA
jgi:hypothetical protein